ncbi:MAG: GNAT family N-acetyltransferase [Crenarchaeota archaeon]|nr:GNAT family N-acetyltransferase [Thermoproteota archaeon]
MLRIVEGYDGSDPSVNEEIARLVNRYRRAVNPALYGEEDPSRVSEWFDEDSLACLAYLGSQLVGIAFLREAAMYTHLWLAVDPSYEPSYVASEVVEWGAREKVRRGFRKPLRVSAGYESSHVARAVRDALCSYAVRYDTTLMRLTRAPPSIERPEGYSFRIASPSDAEQLSRVYNDAFSRYPWFRPSNPSRFEEGLRREGSLCLVAERGGEVAAFCLSRVYRALDGELSGYVALLAVSSSHRGRGLGRYLLKLSVEEMVSRGVDIRRVFLDSVEGLEGYYRAMGFVDVDRYVTFLLPYP